MYFPRYFEDATLGLRGVERTVGGDQAALHSLEVLIEGPDGPERAADFEYPLNPRTKIISFGLADGTAVVELGPELDQVRGRPFSELAYWSIVYTLTEVPGVRAVSLIRDGRPLETFGFPPVALKQVTTRGDAPAWVAPR